MHSEIISQLTDEEIDFVAGGLTTQDWIDIATVAIVVVALL